MDDMTRFEDRFEERIRAFARTGVRQVDSAAVARTVAVGYPRSAATRPGRYRLWNLRSMSSTAFAAAAVVAVVALGGAFIVIQRGLPAVAGPSPTSSAHPSPSLPGVVAPSFRPSATASNPSAFPRTTGAWIPTGSMSTPRPGHTAVRLLDGRVLVVGAFPGDEPESAVASAELYDPESGTWSTAASMLRPHTGFRATLLRDGRVLVGDIDNPTADNPVRAAGVYDPASGTWTVTGKMVISGHDRSATLLRDGRVLVVGSGGAELYDPDRDIWTATGEIISGPIGRPAPVLLLDGRVLVTGGFGDGTGYAGDSAELYDPDTGTWSATGSMGTPRFGHVVVRLLDGRVLVVGGGFDDGNDTSAELYDPASGTWSATGTMLMPHGSTFSGTSATVLRDGTVLVVGGDGAELYDPESGTWSVTAEMVTPIDGPATLLLDGTVLVAGGATSSAGLYVPAGVTPPPAVAALPTPTPTPIPTPISTPTPISPEAGPVPPGARPWRVTVVNKSSEPATLFVAEEDSTGMTRLVGSVTPDVVPAGATAEVTFRLPAKGVDGWWIFVNPGPDNGALLAGTDVPLPGEIRITADGQVGWLSP